MQYELGNLFSCCGGLFWRASTYFYLTANKNVQYFWVYGIHEKQVGAALREFLCRTRVCAHHTFFETDCTIDCNTVKIFVCFTHFILYIRVFLLWQGKRFEIFPDDLPASRRLIYYTGSRARSKYFLHFLRETHSFYLTLSPYAQQMRKIDGKRGMRPMRAIVGVRFVASYTGKQRDLQWDSCKYCCIVNTAVGGCVLGTLCLRPGCNGLRFARAKNFI